MQDVHIVTITYDNLIEQIYSFETAQDAERGFAKLCEDYGVEANNLNIDDGYMELADGHTICLNTAMPFDEVVD